jgi:hypothetical protein
MLPKVDCACTEQSIEIIQRVKSPAVAHRLIIPPTSAGALLLKPPESIRREIKLDPRL